MNNDPHADGHTGSLRRAVLSLGASASVARVMNLGVIAILGRSVGTDAVGRYGVATVAASVAALGISLGFGTFTTREFAAGRLSITSLSAIHRFRLVMLAAAGGALAVVGRLSYPSQSAGFTLYCVAVLLDQWNDTAWASIRGTGRAHREAVVNSTTYAGLLAASAILWVAGAASFTTLGASAAALAGVRATLAVATSRVSLRSSPNVGSAATYLSQTRSALPYLAADLLGLAYLRGDTLILAAFVSPTQLGGYVAAATLTAPLVQVGSAMSYGAIAVLTAAAQTGTRRDAPVLGLFGTVGTALAACVSLGMVPAALILFGHPASDLIIRCGLILSLFIPLRFANFALSSITLANGAVGRRVQIVGLSVAVNVGLNLAFDPTMGPFGAAWASVLTELCIFVFFLGAAGQWGNCARASLPGLASAVAVAPAILTETRQWSALPTGLVNAVVLAAGALALRVLPPQDTSEARSRDQRRRRGAAGKSDQSSKVPD